MLKLCYMCVCVCAVSIMNDLYKVSITCSFNNAETHFKTNFNYQRKMSNFRQFVGAPFTF